MTDEVLASGLAWGAVEVDVGEPGGPPPDAARVAPPERPGDPVAQPDAPTAVQGRHLPALDGVRGVAVTGVILYHLGYSWASGGYLGVDLFFVLSGFLITSLLLEDWARTGRLRLGGFYGRRARRLLPALCLMLCLVALYVALNGRFGPSGTSVPVDLSGLRHEGLASLFYVANLQLIFSHQSYFAQFSAPSPLTHTWSLAIEEQFYLLWPPILLGLLVLAKTRWRRVGIAVAVAAGLASAAWMAILFHPGVDPSRVYYGTDTRAFELFAGIALAMLAAARLQPGPRARRTLHVAGPLAAAGLAAFWVLGGTPSGLPRDVMYRGGLLACAVLAAVILADVRQLDQGPLAWALSRRTICWIGTISYGLYIYHYPVFIFVNADRTGLTGPALAAVRVGLTLVLATASFYLVERPLRRARFHGWRRFAIAPAVAVGVAAALVIVTIPAVASPGGVVAVKATGTGLAAVPGTGGFSRQVPITLPKGRVLSAADPLRVTLIGDSVMWVAAPGIQAALQATDRVAVTDRAIVGFGLTTAHNWPTSFRQFVSTLHPELVVATWSWDDTAALDHPVAYKKTLESAVRELLTPGDGVDGVIFTEFPPSGPFFTVIPNAAALTQGRQREQAAWDKIVRSLPPAFPGKVMYLPIAPSVLLHGQFSEWLPPVNDPHAPKSRWVRVRMVDRVHLCPPGVVRYSSALLVDLTTLFGLPPAKGPWYAGTWQHDPRYNDPPGTCPDDHPPG